MSKCKIHPFYTHGFMRNMSHTAGEYVCECDCQEEPKIHWFNFSNRYSVDEFSDFMDVDVAITFDDPNCENSEYCVSFKIGNHSYIIGSQSNEYIGVSDDKRQIILCTHNYL